ncbi:ATP-dependent helicase, partial [Nonomuraea wenchangensis]
MVVVHGVWTEDGLAFWAEDVEDGGPARAGRGTGPRPHPFAAPAAAVAAALGLDEPAERTLELLLPGSAGEPSPSPETGRLTEAARPRLRPWRVPAVVPPAATALRLLAGRQETATLRHWAAVADLARDLVRRGRVLPQLALESGGARAVWRPIVNGADGVHFRELALAMPPACRTAAAERPSAGVLRAALETFADALVRQALTEPLVTGPATPRDRWLAALTGPDPSCPDVPELRAELAAWHDAAAAAEGAARVCFRLKEPAGDPAGD